MIEETITHSCRKCHSSNIVKNGKNAYGNQQYRCKDCGASAVLQPKCAYSQEEKELIIKAYQERPSMRAIERIFGVCRQTLSTWLKKKAADLPELSETLKDKQAQAQASLELDELWSYVGSKKNKVWVWVALDRSTRQVVSYALGDRSHQTCQQLWLNIPEPYRQHTCYTDFWEAYGQVIPSQLHQSVGKETGYTAHIERWYNTLRQHLGRFVRDTLSFSKNIFMHEVCLKLFIHRYNRELLPASSSIFKASFIN